MPSRDSAGGIELLVTSGEYSDYGILGLLRVPSLAWVNAQWREFVEYALLKAEGPTDSDCFLEWMVNHGAQQVEQHEYHLHGWSVNAADRNHVPFPGVSDAES